MKFKSIKFLAMLLTVVATTCAFGKTASVTVKVVGQGKISVAKGGTDTTYASSGWSSFDSTNYTIKANNNWRICVATEPVGENENVFEKFEVSGGTLGGSITEKLRDDSSGKCQYYVQPASTSTSGNPDEFIIVAYFKEASSAPTGVKLDNDLTNGSIEVVSGDVASYVGSSSEPISLRATPNDGYSILGWYACDEDGGNKKYFSNCSTTASYSGVAGVKIGVDFTDKECAVVKGETTDAPSAPVAMSLADAVAQDGLSASDRIHLLRDYTIPNGTTITLNAGKNLVVPEGVTLTVEGVLEVENSGYIWGDGMVSSSGIKLEQEDEIIDCGALKYQVTKIINGAAGTISAVSGGIKNTITVSSPIELSVGDEKFKVDYNGNGKPAALLCSVNPNVSINHITGIDKVYTSLKDAILESNPTPSTIPPADKIVVLLSYGNVVCGDFTSAWTAHATSDNQICCGMRIDCAGFGLTIGPGINDGAKSYFINGALVTHSTTVNNCTDIFVGCETVSEKINVNGGNYSSRAEIYNCGGVLCSYEGDQDIVANGGGLWYMSGGPYALPDNSWNVRACGGTFSTDPSNGYLPSPEYESVKIDEGVWQVVKSADIDYNFYIGDRSMAGNRYATLSEAIDAAGVDDVIVLAKDSILESGIEIAEGKVVSIDLNGCKLDVNGEIGFVNNGVLKIEDNSNYSTGKGKFAPSIVNNGELLVCYGTYTGEISLVSGSYSLIYAGTFNGAISIADDAETEIRGGTFKQSMKDWLKDGYREKFFNGVYYVGKAFMALITETTLNNCEKAYKVKAADPSFAADYLASNARSQYTGTDADERWYRHVEAYVAVKPFSDYRIDGVISFDHSVNSGSVMFYYGAYSGKELPNSMEAGEEYCFISPLLEQNGSAQIMYGRFLAGDPTDAVMVGMRNVAPENNGTVCTVELRLYSAGSNNSVLTLASRRMVLGAGDNVAMIRRDAGVVFYPTLQAAVDAATGGEVVQLTCDCAEEVVVGNGHSCILDANGMNFTGSVKANAWAEIPDMGMAYFGSSDQIPAMTKRYVDGELDGVTVYLSDEYVGYPQAWASHVEGFNISDEYKDRVDIAYSFYAMNPAENTTLGTSDWNIYFNHDLDSAAKASRFIEISNAVQPFLGNDWHADFEVYFDHSIKKESVTLTGAYGSWMDGTLLSYQFDKDLDANERYRLLNDYAAIHVSYKEILNSVQKLGCGVKNFSVENFGTKMTVELRLYKGISGHLEGTNPFSILVGKYEYTFGAAEINVAADGMSDAIKAIALNNAAVDGFKLTGIADLVGSAAYGYFDMAVVDGTIDDDAVTGLEATVTPMKKADGDVNPAELTIPVGKLITLRMPVDMKLLTDSTDVVNLEVFCGDTSIGVYPVQKLTVSTQLPGSTTATATEYAFVEFQANAFPATYRYALYEDPEEYTITYVTGKDGVAVPEDAPTSYTKNDEVALPTLSTTGFLFLGWKASAAGEYLSKITKGTIGNLTLTGYWKDVADTTPVEMEVAKGTSASGAAAEFKVEVTSDVVQAATESGKSVAEVLNAKEDNGLAKWENMAIEQANKDSTATVTTSMEGQGTVTDSKVNVKVEITEGTTGVKGIGIAQITKVDDAKVVVRNIEKLEVDAGSTAVIPFDFKDCETGVYQPTIFVEKDDVKVEVPDPNAVSITVLKPTSDQESVIVPVPGDKTAAGGEVSIANVIDNSSLAAGDQIRFYNENGHYDVWTRDANGNWVEGTTVSDQGQSQAKPADEVKLPAGGAFWLTRKTVDATKPVTVIAQTKDVVETPVAAGWNLLANPKAEEIDLDKVCEKVSAADDKIVVPTKGLAQKTYTFKNGKWGYTEYYSENGRVKARRVLASEEKIAPGQGLWYVSGEKKDNKVEWNNK